MLLTTRALGLSGWVCQLLSYHEERAHGITLTTDAALSTLVATGRGLDGFSHVDEK
jgi:hypothetical protein